MSLIGRIVVVLFALLCASMAASTMFVIAVLAREWSDVLLPSWQTGVLGVVIGLAAVWISFVVLLPMLAVIAVAEAFAWRSVLIYAGLGLGLGLWVFYSGFVPPEQEVAREREISAAAGIVAGFVYWALAGRNAGRWRERPALRGDRRSEETPSRPEESPR